MPNKWWDEARMGEFGGSRRAYEASPSEFPELAVSEIAVNDVRPLIRAATHGVFNDRRTRADL